MKKVLVTVLTLAILLTAFTLTSLAVEPVTILGFSKGDGTPMLDDRYIEDFGTIILSKDTNTLEIPILWENFLFDIGVTPHPKEVTQEVMDLLYLDIVKPDTRKLFEAIHDKHTTADENAKYSLIPRQVGLADSDIYLVYDDGYGNVQRSAPVHIYGRFVEPTINSTILSINDVKLDKNTFINGKAVTSQELKKALGEIRPGTEIAFAIDTEFFNWEPDIWMSNSAVRKATLDNDQISVKKDVVNGSSVIKEVVIENIDDRAYVIVRFIESYDNVVPRDFEISVTLAQRNVRHKPTRVELIGSVENDILEVSEDGDYAYIGDGSVVTATAFCRNITLDLGSDLSLVMNLTQDKKYYARAVDTLTDDDRGIMEAYPQIRKTITVKAYNIPLSDNNVAKLDLEKQYHVYDSSGKYLGLSNTSLPFRAKYYLAEEPIVLDIGVGATDDSDYDDFIEDEDEDNPNTGRTVYGASSLSLLGLTVLVGGIFTVLKKDKY